MEYTDEQLVALIKGSKEDAIKGLHYFFRNKDLRKNAVQRILRENDAQLADAEEAVQDSFGRFFNYVRKENFKLTGTLAGLFGTMSLKRFRDKRKLKTHNILPLNEEIKSTLVSEDDDLPDKYLKFEERTTYFDNLLNRKGLVSKNCKKLIREKYWEDKSVARQALYKCLLKLRNYFKESSEEFQVLKNYALSGK